MKYNRKVGIMGGTFNPIHIGHLIMAENAYEQFELDEVIFMPSKNPPHKLNQVIISDSHRLNMVKAAINDNPHFSISTLEIDREGITYTADTLRTLTEENPNTEYYFIIGADSFFQIETWKEPEVIFALSHIIAASRYQLSVEAMQEQVMHLSKKFKGKIDLLSSPTIELSSKAIRTRMEEGKSVKYYVPAQVYRYILENRLYI
jgi:nicotinate-nucleotide adenylyltransferase